MADREGSGANEQQQPERHHAVDAASLLASIGTMAQLALAPLLQVVCACCAAGCWACAWDKAWEQGVRARARRQAAQPSETRSRFAKYHAATARA